MSSRRVSRGAALGVSQVQLVVPRRFAPFIEECLGVELVERTSSAVNIVIDAVITGDAMHDAVINRGGPCRLHFRPLGR